MKNLASIVFLERPIEDLDWVLYVLIFTMILVAVGRVAFYNNFESLKKFDSFQEVNDNQGLFGMMFQVLFAVLVSTILFSYFTPDFDYVLYTPYIKVGVLSALILLFFATRSTLGRIASFAFGISYDQSFNLKAFNFFRAYSVAALWISVLLFYFTAIDKLVLLLLLVLFLFFIRAISYLRVLKNKEAEKSKIWYYNILYLCALEILPLLVLFKFLNTW